MSDSVVARMRETLVKRVDAIDKILEHPIPPADYVIQVSPGLWLTSIDDRGPERGGPVVGSGDIVDAQVMSAGKAHLMTMTANKTARASWSAHQRLVAMVAERQRALILLARKKTS